MARDAPRAAELIGWGDPVPAGRGRGIAVGLKEGPTTGLVFDRPPAGGRQRRRVRRHVGHGPGCAHDLRPDRGAGELGAPIDWVTVVMGDTAVVLYDQQTSASRSSVLMGNAVLNACRDVQVKLRAMAARLEGVDESVITVDRAWSRCSVAASSRSATCSCAGWDGSAAR